MPLPHIYQMFNCVSCKATLHDSNFILCGINLNTRKIDIFFDYRCVRCGHHGRYLIPQDDYVTASAALGKLAEMVSDAGPTDDEDSDDEDAGCLEFNGT